MVHSKPEYAESTKLLTFSQLKKLEKIDAKKEREAKRIELAKEGLRGGSEILGRALEGTITGPVILALGLTATYPGWSKVVGAGADEITKDIANAWKNQNRPEIQQLPGPQGTTGVVIGTGDYSFTVSGFYGVPITTIHYTTAAERDAGLVQWKHDAGFLVN